MTTPNEALRKLAEAATPGPWAWMQSGRGSVDLATPHSGRLIVMDFVRKGMQSAEPRFAIVDGQQFRGRKGGILYTATEIMQRNDGLLAHPDAEFIAAANPAKVIELLDRIDRLEADAARYQWIRHRTGGTRNPASGEQSFAFPTRLGLPPLGNIMQGSIAGHLDAAIDAQKDTP